MVNKGVEREGIYIQDQGKSRGNTGEVTSAGVRRWKGHKLGICLIKELSQTLFDYQVSKLNVFSFDD